MSMSKVLDMTNSRHETLRYPNPIPPVFVFFVVALVVGGALVAYLWLNPDVAGFPRTEKLGQHMYRFANLQLERPHLYVEFTNGWLVPLHRSGEVSGALIIGSGSYLVEPSPGAREKLLKETGHEEIHDTLRAVYVPSDFKTFEDMVYRARAVEQTSGFIRERALDYLEAIQKTPTTVEAYGIRRDWYTNPNVVQLFGRTYGRVSYAAAESVTLSFLDIQGLELSLGEAHDDVSMTRLSSLLSLAPRYILVYLALTILCVFLVFVLTLDLVPNQHMQVVSQLASHWSSRALGFLALAGLALELLATTVLNQPGLSSIAPAVWRVGAVTLVCIYLWRLGVPRPLFGLTVEHLGRAIMVGVLLGVLAFTCGILALPTGIKALAPAELARQTAWNLAIVGYAGEVFRRGLIQAHAELLLGTRWGLISTSLAFALVYLGAEWFVGRQLSTAALLQGGLVIPCTNFLLGYIFQRTGTVHAGAITAGLIGFLPQVVIF